MNCLNCGNTIVKINRGRCNPYCSQKDCQRIAKNAAMRKYRATHPQQWSVIRKAAQLKYECKNFGITTDVYYQMLKGQKGVCAICFSPEALGRRLAIDHCHATNKVRGLLCYRCNTSIGKFDDSTVLLANAISYLKKFSRLKNEESGESLPEFPENDGCHSAIN